MVGDLRGSGLLPVSAGGERRGWERQLGEAVEAVTALLVMF